MVSISVAVGFRVWLAANGVKARMGVANDGDESGVSASLINAPAKRVTPLRWAIGKMESGKPNQGMVRGNPNGCSICA